MAALLADPIPKITGVLVSSERRFATVDNGRIVRVGDAIGHRTVVAIDDRSVVLREPSGARIRVGLGGRVLRIERGRL